MIAPFRRDYSKDGPVYLTAVFGFIGWGSGMLNYESTTRHEGMTEGN